MGTLIHCWQEDKLRQAPPPPSAAQLARAVMLTPPPQRDLPPSISTPFLK